MDPARHHVRRRSPHRFITGAARRRTGRRISLARDREDWVLELRLAPAQLTLAGGLLTYTAADGESNQLAVDVVPVAGVDFIRFREAGGVVIDAQDAGLVVNSPQEVLAPVAGTTGLDIATGDLDDTVNLTLADGLPAAIQVDTGTAVVGDSLTIEGTAADDAIGLAPRRNADGLKTIVLTEADRTVTIAMVGRLTLDLSQDGQDTLTVDRSITGYGREVSLNVIGGGVGTDTMSVIAPGSVPQTMTLSDGRIRVDDARSGNELFLGRSDNTAIDQPKVQLEVITDDGSGNPVSLGPEAFNTFLLDTGATSILSALEATSELVGNGYQTHDIPYLEQGVAGDAEWDVSLPYRFDFAGTSGERHTLDDVQILSSETNSFSFFGPWGIVGMPAMVGRVTTADLTRWIDLQDPEDLSMQVDFSDEPPASSGHSYSVPLQLVDFPASGQLEGGPVPTMAPLPFLDVKTSDDGHEVNGKFILDTGAQLSLISTQTAIALGLDKNGNGSLDDEALDFIEVGGIGGTVSIPLVAIDRASVATDQGPNMVWTDLLVGVLDLDVPDGPQIAGVFGMDYLTSGWAAHVLPPLLGDVGSPDLGYFQHISFDFRDAANHSGSLILDVTPERDVITPPAVNSLEVTYSNLDRVTATTGSGDDTFFVTPSTTTRYAIDGGDHSAGDTFNLFPPGFNVVDDGGKVHIDGYQDIQYSRIEHFNFAATAQAGVTISPTGGLVTTEAGGTATLTIVLDSQPTADVTIPLSSSNSAEGTVSPASLTFTPADWNVPQTITITGVDDFVDDGDVAYSIVTGPATSSDTEYSGLNPADVTVTNIDDDTAGITVSPTLGLRTTEAGGTARFTVILNSQPTADVTIALSSSDTTEGTVAPASITFTPANWNVAQTVTITGVDDLVSDGDVPYTIVTGAATSSDAKYDGLNADDVAVVNRDDDVAGITVAPTSGLVTTEAGGTASFTVVLNSQPTANVTIALSSSDTTEGTVAPASLTFTAANWNTAQAVTVTGVDDAIADGDVSYIMVTAAAASADARYNGMNASDVSVTNIDNDTAGITVSPTSGLVTTEAGGTASFTVVLNSQPTADVTVALSSSDTTEGTVAPASITFTPANWNVAQTVTITGVDDLVADGAVPYTIATAAAVSADPNYSGMNAPDVSVTNTDDDTAGITVAPTSGLVTTEAGGTATFTVVLNSQPTANVTIALSSSDTTEGTVSPASLTFTPANWDVAQTVTITGVDDAIADGDVAYTIVTAAAASADGSYSGLDANDVSVTNTDNDTAGITVTPTSGLVTTEAGGTATFTVVLTSQPTADVTIPLSSSNSAEGTVAPASLTFTTDNWNVPQTVTVTGVDDLVVDGDIAYSIVTGPATSTDPSYAGRDAADVALTNTDNDVDALPTIQSVVVDDGTAQRSMVRQLVVTFSELVTLDEGAFELRHQGGALVGLHVAKQDINGHTVVTLTFSGAEIIAGSLADGNYRLTVLADKVHDSAGQNLDGNQDGAAHDDAIEDLYRLFGDTDGDRDVDNTDFFFFRKAYFGQVPFVSFLDVDGDGQYTQADLDAFLARHNTKLLA